MNSDKKTKDDPKGTTPKGEAMRPTVARKLDVLYSCHIFFTSNLILTHLKSAMEVFKNNKWWSTSSKIIKLEIDTLRK